MYNIYNLQYELWQLFKEHPFLGAHQILESEKLTKNYQKLGHDSITRQSGARADVKLLKITLNTNIAQGAQLI